MYERGLNITQNEKTMNSLNSRRIVNRFCFFAYSGKFQGKENKAIQVSEREAK